MIPQITVRVGMISYASRVVLVLFGYAISFSPNTPAQVLTPESLLEEVVSLHQGTMEASFVHKLSSELWEGSRTLTGSIRLSGDQYRIETLFEIIIGRGDEVWIYRPEDQQVLITSVEESDLAYSPGALFHSYERLYRAHAYTRETLGGIPHFRLELHPAEENFLIRSLTLWLKADDRLVTRLVALDQDDTRTEIELTEVRVGVPIPPETFEFTLPEDVEVIDLRS